MKVPKSATAVSQPAGFDELLAQHSSCVDPTGSWYVTGFSMRGNHFLLLQFLMGSSEDLTISTEVIETK
ncbi:uncharacterized protein PITG_17742 [Phytophthora infestans T30-4]|uniref:Uncharacterized protein n=1 Tax=Phytophthora infestans (strain T30-4) TaxID=403677 RepID=D0NWB7_PHYIT|nr:uncharacterized protein PITG_17742 [Phytophthora infestans T30-4]EEY66968.1 hypothetical protein PITG_17742 [Phytophthora infestans T30-4]|eukprot:XP_002896598.1 hypothetical protein PITG_17742 [Phytophthora infestans T30-4]